MAEAEVRKGLAGVVADVSAISTVNQETNSLLYRGYPVTELVAEASFEEVALLLWNGEFPTADELTAFSVAERSRRALGHDLRKLIDKHPLTSHPMDVLRTAVSFIGAHDTTLGDDSRENELDRSITLFAKLPAIVAYDQRRRRGLDLVEPHDELDYSQNFLYMTFGEMPGEAQVDAFRATMILYAEHSFNASTFTARVITSTLSDLYSAVTGAIGALKGTLHGGANEAVQRLFEQVESPELAREWVLQQVDAKRKIMGFGHRVYKHGDSRVPTARAALEAVVVEIGDQRTMPLYEAIENAMTERTGILPNLDYPSGPLYHLLGFDTETFTPLFVASRITGWTAHIMEQRAANALIRPLAAYNGVEQRSLADRDAE